MKEIIFYIIIGIVIFDFLFERILDYLNNSMIDPVLPDELKGIYDKEKYQTSQNYLKENSRFSMISSTFMFLIIATMLLFKGFEVISHFTEQITSNSFIQSLIFFGILAAGSEIIGIPFQWFDTFVIEERYGFNNTTKKTFLFDKIKSWIIGIIIGGAILLFIQWAYVKGGDLFWVIGLGGTAIFIVFITMFYTSLLLPLFNKLTPLDEGPLKEKIQDFASKSGFILSNIYVMDGSKRSTKANAFFSGLGPKKKIILYDTLIEKLDENEIVAVLAHEIGHYKKRHIYKGLAMSLVQIGIMFFMLWLALKTPEVGSSLGSDNFYMGLLAFGLLYSPISFIMSIVSNTSSRKHEYEADAFASNYGLGQNLINALIKLSVSSLSNLRPHSMYVFFHYSHPTLLQRKKAIEKNNH
ncbi:MAG: M48 family metallopeptidase [Bacteroidales bacterium]|nr:M48 family metallopeptidase [Bacteroidales bacterium]